MDCEKIRELMEAYLEGAAAGGERQALETHLKSCEACRGELASLKVYFHEMDGLDEVPPPPDFLRQVHARIEPPSGLREFFRSLFLPFHVKIPLELAAMALVIVTLVWFVKKPEPSFQTVPAGTGTPPRPAVHEKAAGKILPQPESLMKKEPEEKAPAGEKREGKAGNEAFHAGGRAVNLSEKKGDAGKTMAGHKKGPEPAQEEIAVEIIITPGKITQDKAFEKSRVQSGAAGAKPASEDGQSRLAKAEEAMAPSVASGAPAEARKDEISEDYESAFARIARFADALGGRILQTGDESLQAFQHDIVAEIPSGNFSMFMENLKSLGMLRQAHARVPGGPRPVLIRIRISGPLTNGPSD